MLLSRLRARGALFTVAASLSVVALTAMSAYAAPKLNIDYATGEDFVEKGTIRIYFDLLDDEFRVIQGLQSDSVKIFIDDKEIPGTVEVQTFAQAKEWVGLALLLAGHRAYAALEAGEDDSGEAVERPPAAFDMEKKGFINLIRKLEGGDRVSVFTYSEQGLKPVVAWTEGHQRAAETVDSRATMDPFEVKDIVAPRLYDSIKAVLGEVTEKVDDLPRRKILMVMSDGKDSRAINRKRAEQTIRPIVEAASDNGVKIYTIGYTMDDPEPLVYLQELSASTKGVYREIPADADPTTIPEIIENMGTQLKKQYVVTFTPNEDYDGSEEPVSIRVEVKTPDKEDALGQVDSVKIGKKPTDWMKYVMWAGIGLGSLLGLFLIFKLIGAIIRSRRNRPVEYVEEDAGPVGPYKGKLTCTEGDYAGGEFYLTEDVTTIGAMDGNDIIVQAPGVSKRHAGIKIEDMRFELADFGSTNGTYVNGSKITKQFLRDGDNIQIGDLKFKFTLK